MLNAQPPKAEGLQTVWLISSQMIYTFFGLVNYWTRNGMIYMYTDIICTFGSLILKFFGPGHLGLLKKGQKMIISAKRVVGTRLLAFSAH